MPLSSVVGANGVREASGVPEQFGSPSSRCQWRARHPWDAQQFGQDKAGWYPSVLLGGSPAGHSWGLLGFPWVGGSGLGAGTRVLVGVQPRLSGDVRTRTCGRLGFGATKQPIPRARRTCASLLHSTRCCPSRVPRWPRSSSPQRVSWSGCGAARAARAARVGGGARVPMTPRCAGGGIWTWARASCCWRLRSAGWTVGVVVGSGPKMCPGRARGSALA
jgi:hypothetical protein